MVTLELIIERALDHRYNVNVDTRYFFPSSLSFSFSSFFPPSPPFIPSCTHNFKIPTRRWRISRELPTRHNCFVSPLLHHRLRRSNASVLLRCVPCVGQSVSRCIVASRRSWKGREREGETVLRTLRQVFRPSSRINNASFSKRPLTVIVPLYIFRWWIFSFRREKFLNVCVFPSSYLFLSFHTADSPSVTTYVQSRVSTRMGVTLHVKHAYRIYRYHGEYLRMHLRSIVSLSRHQPIDSFLPFISFLTSLWIIHRNSRLETIQSIDTTRIERRSVLRYNLSRLDSWKWSIHARHEDTQIHAHRYSASYVWRAHRRCILGEKRGSGEKKEEAKEEERWICTRSQFA